jgi:hypothetical protein
MFWHTEREYSERFQRCVSYYENLYRYHQRYERNSNLQFLGDSGDTGDSNTICTITTIERHAAFFSMLLSAVLAFFTFTLWRTTRNLWVESKKQFGLARDEFDANHRPWLAINDIRLVEPVSFAQKLMGFTIEVGVGNTGHSPATEILLFPIAIRYGEQLLIPEKLAGFRQQYEDLKNSRSWTGDRLPESVIFPGQTSPFRHMLQIPLEEDMVAPNDNDLIMSGPMIIGALCYRSTFSKNNLYSTFVYGMNLKNGSWPLRDDLGRRAVVPEGRIGFQKWFTGWTAA